MRNSKVLTFYREEMCMKSGVSMTSSSPEKPRLMMKYSDENGFGPHLCLKALGEVNVDYTPILKKR